LAISERLSLEKAGVDLRNVPARVVWFKQKLAPKTVLSGFGRLRVLECGLMATHLSNPCLTGVPPMKTVGTRQGQGGELPLGISP
jgi:hypothetical protein